MDASDLHCTCHLCDGTSVHMILPDGDGATAWHYTSTGIHQLPLED